MGLKQCNKCMEFKDEESDYYLKYNYCKCCKNKQTTQARRKKRDIVRFQKGEKGEKGDKEEIISRKVVEEKLDRILEILVKLDISAIRQNSDLEKRPQPSSSISTPTPEVTPKTIVSSTFSTFPTFPTFIGSTNNNTPTPENTPEVAPTAVFPAIHIIRDTRCSSDIDL
jgi:hypothetical protein